jgi:hypothetical protein
VLSAGFNLNYLEFVFDSVYVDPINSIDQKFTTAYKNSFNVYPTIINNEVIIKASDQNILKGAEYKLIDIQGKTLMHGNINQSIESIDVSPLNEGVYILKITHQSTRLNEFKLIK